MAPHAVAAPALTPRKNLALRRSAFLPLLGQTFRIVHDRDSLTVVLRQVSDLKPSVRPGAEYQFSLIFTAPASRSAFSQGTYPISHARRGQISLFVVPVGRSETAQHYQAIIDSQPATATGPLGGIGMGHGRNAVRTQAQPGRDHRPAPRGMAGR